MRTSRIVAGTVTRSDYGSGFLFHKGKEGERNGGIGDNPCNATESDRNDRTAVTLMKQHGCGKGWSIL